MTSDDEVRSRLRALPQPVMPESVARSVHSTLSSAEPAPDVVSITGGDRRRMRTLLVAAAAAAALVLVGLASEPQRTPAPGGVPVMRAGAIFEPTGFAQTLRERFLGGAPIVARTDTFADTPAGLAACTRAVDAYGHVIGIDAGRYSSSPAVVLITSYPGNREYEEIWVVAPTCSETNPTVMRHMLYDLDNSAATL